MKRQTNRGNTKLVENSELKNLYITQPLLIHSLNKRFTRHMTNACLYLKPTEHVLLYWLVGYSNGINVIVYSTQLLRLFDAASDRAIEIYGKERIQYTTSMTNVREAFISLVEKGLLIKLTRKANYMINPMVVYTSNKVIFDVNNCQNAYMYILKSADGDNELIKKGLTNYCDNLLRIYEKELLRTNINERKKLDAIKTGVK